MRCDTYRLVHDDDVVVGMQDNQALHRLGDDRGNGSLGGDLPLDRLTGSEAV